MTTPALPGKAGIVLDMTRRGMTARAIAEHLGVRINCVHSHLTRLREKGLLPRPAETPAKMQQICTMELIVAGTVRAEPRRGGGRPAEDCPDGPQYKAFGNSMATNVMAWIGRRLDAELRRAA